MKEVFIVGSYCNSSVKLKALREIVTRAKSLGFDVIVYGKYPIPEDIQTLCDFWIYDKKNLLIPDRSVNIWESRFGKTCSKIVRSDWGYAVFEQIKRSLGFAKLLNYEVAYWFNYDVDITHFLKFYKVCIEKIKEYDMVFYKWDNNTRNGIALTSMCFKVHESYDRICGLINDTSYKKISNDTNMIAEEIFEKILDLSDSKFYKISEKNELAATIDSFGNRTNGNIPNDFTKTLNYFNKCFIGKDLDKNKKIIFISFIKVKMNEIKLDFGNDNIVTFSDPEINSNNCIELLLEDSLKPTQLKIVSINSDEINEILDEHLNDEYFNSNFIENCK